jgi:hypothetical protein
VPVAKPAKIAKIATIEKRSFLWRRNRGRENFGNFGNPGNFGNAVSVSTVAP